MPFIIGWLLGPTLARLGVLRAIGAALLLSGASLTAFQIVSKNVDPNLGTPAAVAVPAGLFAWSMWDPALHRFRLWVADGFYLLFRFAMWLTVAMVVMMLLQSGFHLRLWFGRAWSWAALSAVLWAIQHALGTRIKRSHRLATNRDVREPAA